MDEYHKKRLAQWKEKADLIHHDHWVRFIIYWMIFDSYLTEMSLNDHDSLKLKWFFENENELKTIFRKYWSRPEYISVLECLKSFSPISDLRPSQRSSNPVQLNDIKDENEVFNFIYKIRCNTFHGGKDLHDKRDNRLTQCGEILFNKPLGDFLGL